MPLQAISPRVYEVGVGDPHRRIYDRFFVLPDGTSFNAYLLTGDKKTALIDTVVASQYIQMCENLQDAGLEKLDYLVLMTSQEDYARVLPDLLIRNPQMKILCSESMKIRVQSLASVNDDAFMVVPDGYTLDLGSLHLTCRHGTYSQIVECSSAYLEEANILFSGALFAAHYTDESVFAKHSSDEISGARRFYASQLMPYREGIRDYLNTVEEMPVRMIAPAHGQVWQDPRFILKLYRHWTSDEVSPDVVIAYVSRYGYIKRLVEQLMFSLVAKGVSVTCRNIAEKPESLLKESSAILSDLVHASTFILASSPMLNHAHPSAAYLASLLRLMKPKMPLYGFVTPKNAQNDVTADLDRLLACPKTGRLPDLTVSGNLDGPARQQIDDYAEQLIERIKKLPNLKTLMRF